MSACTTAKQYAPLLGRVLIAIIFILSGFGKIGGFEQTAGYMASKGLPMVPLLLTLTIVVELGGGLMLALGIKARWAALVIFLFMIPVTLVFHGFWAAPEAARQMEMIQFLKNIAIMGGLSYIMAYGAGPFSLTRDECKTA